jgi:pimeloyl-ACP methyl ester carboxylesterase
VRVKNRHVIYVQGYDPRGLAQYYRMFRTELRKFEKLYHLTAKIGRPENITESEIASWTIETKAQVEADEWQTRTTYDFLRFEDFIQRDLALPIWHIVSYTIWIYFRLIINGTIFRFMKANWRFLTFITWPHIVFWFEVACIAFVASLIRRGLDAAGVPWPFDIVAAAIFCFGMLWTVVKYTEKRTYLLYLMCDTIWTWEFSHRERPEWDERLDRFAQHLVDVARAGEADEIVLVGHSSGSFLGTEILARALKLDPALGKHGPRIMLLTLGGNYPIVGFHKAASDFREHLRQLAVEPQIEWIECQARKDVMNFFDLDPIASHGIDAGPARRNPTIVPLRFREMILPENYGWFRWQFFRVHFQFVMTNEIPHAYDFFMIVCGPVPLRERFAHPQAALAVATGDAPTREKGWTMLEPVPMSGSAGAEMGGLEPSAQHPG